MPRNKNDGLCKSSSKAVPKRWPENVIFTDTPVYSSSLSAESRAALKKKSIACVNENTTQITRGPVQDVRIALINDPAHPAYGQRGLFATRHLPPDTFILSYVGYVHGENDTDLTSDYDLSLDRSLAIAVDAAKMGNEARFINDYRGVGPPSPNAEFRDTWISDGRGLSENRIGVFVLAAGKAGKRAKGIAKGEEILVSYGKGFWAGRHKETEAADEV